MPLPELDPSKLKGYKNRIYKMMNEEDPNSEPLKLFRPIYLVNDGGENRSMMRSPLNVHTIVKYRLLRPIRELIG